MVRLLSACSLICLAFSASAVELRGALTQGSLLRGQAAVGETIQLNGQAVTVADDGQFVIGFGRDAELTQQLAITSADGQRRIETIELRPREYRIQRIEGIAKRIMQPNPDDVARAQRDAKLARAARARFESSTAWQQDFIWPLQGRITGVYGSQRIYNGEPKSPHFGIDIAAPSGTEVVAPAAGIVTLTEDMFYSGNTVIIDHGHGVSSTFLHLSRMLVKPGDVVEQGQVVAQVGSTGRSTGPHLDWRMNWFSERVDPSLLVPAMPR
ncbi:M23 family metallopeptidase [Ferrimonas senticii]|uniref:M23 family metallopeptidase n=1 Tax=Ferrimonas senticii TaxID=394566 RepID=UPI000424B361|nr:M23 family metallopeptidase [Ferrimonas senticii]